ncbi:MAG: hypothetical protein KDD25_02840, partial [Bdellovibrionales bacterium]|nr:hypothetical protein [Bdellovibrionales bacterium]
PASEFRKSTVMAAHKMSNEDRVLDEEPKLGALYRAALNKKRDEDLDSRSTSWFELFLGKRLSYPQSRTTFNASILKWLEGLLGNRPPVLSENSSFLSYAKVKSAIESIPESPQNGGVSDRLKMRIRDRQIKVLRQVVEIGADMGFFLLPEKTDGDQYYYPTARKILSNLGPPERTRFSVDWFKGFVSANSDFYFAKYLDEIRKELLNSNRILELEVSGYGDKKAYEIIEEQCRGEVANCESFIQNLTTQLLSEREKQLHELLGQILNGNERFGPEQLLKYTEVIDSIRSGQPVAMDVHADRVAKLMGTSVARDTFQAVDADVRGTTNTMLIVLAIRWASMADQRFGILAGTLTPLAESLWASSSSVVTGYLVGTLPFLMAGSVDRIVEYYGSEKPGYELTNDLYFAFPKENEIVSYTLKEMNQKLSSFKSKFIWMDIGIIALVIGSFALGPIANRFSGLYTRARISQIEGHLTRIGVEHPKRFGWDMSVLNETANAQVRSILGGVAEGNASRSQLKAIAQVRSSQRAVESFYQSFQSGVYNHMVSLAPLKSRVGIDPNLMNPVRISEEIQRIRVATTSPQKLQELRALEKSLTTKHLMLTHYAKNSPLMQRMAIRLLNARMEKVGGAIHESFVGAESALPVVGFDGRVLTIDNTRVFVASPGVGGNGL